MVRILQTISRDAVKRLFLCGNPPWQDLAPHLFRDFKSNRGDAKSNIGKREEAARQLLTHVAEMESAYLGSARIVTIIAGDFNTDPTDARFASEATFALLKEKFVWSWEKVPLSERVTNPAKGRYPDACFDGFFVRGGLLSNITSRYLISIYTHLVTRAR